MRQLFFQLTEKLDINSKEVFTISRFLNPTLESSLRMRVSYAYCKCETSTLSDPIGKPYIDPLCNSFVDEPGKGIRHKSENELG